MDMLYNDKVGVRYNTTPALATDAYGQPIAPNRAIHWLRGCSMQPISAADAALFSNENHAQRYKLFIRLPIEPAVDIETQDLLFVSTSTFVWGDSVFKPCSAAYYFNPPDGAGAHIELFLERGG